MNAEGVNPAGHEVERQLDRMLAHPLFRARAKQVSVFEYLVRSALDGKEINEMILFMKFFKDKLREDEDITHVRTTVSYIRRDLLEKYYAEDGSDDPVIIALPAPERISLPGGKYKIVKRPPREAYAPEFRYNPRGPIWKPVEFLLRARKSDVLPSQARISTACLTAARRQGVKQSSLCRHGPQLRVRSKKLST